jgi:hypothetical protein
VPTHLQLWNSRNRSELCALRCLERACAKPRLAASEPCGRSESVRRPAWANLQRDVATHRARTPHLSATRYDRSFGSSTAIAWRAVACAKSSSKARAMLAARRTGGAITRPRRFRCSRGIVVSRQRRASRDFLPQPGSRRLSIERTATEIVPPSNARFSPEVCPDLPIVGRFRPNPMRRAQCGFQANATRADQQETA